MPPTICASFWKRTNQNSSSKARSIAQEQYLYLTTHGRRSGQAREIEIWFTERQGRYYVIAEYDTSNWIQNLRADPHVQVRIHDRKFAAIARVLGSGNDPSSVDHNLIREVQELSRAKYGWGDGTVVELRSADS
jgi:deazaflavin-dependent oxidoreductase (nitroreductase family)